MLDPVSAALAISRRPILVAFYDTYGDTGDLNPRVPTGLKEGDLSKQQVTGGLEAEVKDTTTYVKLLTVTAGSNGWAGLNKA